MLTSALTREVPDADSIAAPWIELQRWLELDAPYDVAIPFRAAILDAYRKRLKDNETIQLRIRRDVHGLLSAIEASAILHKAQRNRAGQGRIIATLEDYAHAHGAFDGGLAHLYKVLTPETALAVVKAAEAMGASKDVGIKIPGRALQRQLGISSKGTTADRLFDAVERGFLILIEKEKGYGKTSPREFKLGRTSEDIEEEMRAAPPSVFPTLRQVEDAMNFPDGAEEAGKCAVCGRPGAQLCAFGERTTWLHRECQSAFIAAQERSQQ